MDPVLLNVVLLAPLFLGIILSQFLRLPLKGLSAVYLLLSAGNVLLWYFLLGGQWLPPVITAAAGFLVTVVLIGFLGQRVRAADYALAMAGIGLFPWTLWGFMAGIVYAIVLVLFAVLIALRPKFKNPLKRNYK